jgi:hypothetical protein
MLKKYLLNGAGMLYERDLEIIEATKRKCVPEKAISIPVLQKKL